MRKFIVCLIFALPIASVSIFFGACVYLLLKLCVPIPVADALAWFAVGVAFTLGQLFISETA